MCVQASAVVYPVGKERTVLCLVQQIHGGSLVLSVVLVSTMERVGQTMASVDALKDGWGLNATKVKI